MLILLVAASMTLFVKIEKRTLLSLLAAAAVSVPLVWWYLLKGYQKQRILTFLNPDRDPLGAGYHIIQSKIAIGSGMLFGKGYLKGTQNALSFCRSSTRISFFPCWPRNGDLSAPPRCCFFF